MTLLEAIKSRHSVRRYIHKPLSQEIIDTLQAKVDECNRLSKLHIQLVTNETKAFTGLFAYGKFAGVENYFVMIGEKEDDLDERVGYYGEQLVILAQQLGLNTCWAGLSYRKVEGAYSIDGDEKIACMIALGYGENGQGDTIPANSPLKFLIMLIDKVEEVKASDELMDLYYKSLGMNINAASESEAQEDTDKSEEAETTK